jgi:hypothetical protein
LTGTNKSAFVQNAVAVGISNRCKEASSSTAAAVPGATIEHIDNPHQQSVADIKRQELYDEKIIIMNPCDMVGSALKAIQTLLEKLTSKINKYLNKALSYIDAATNIINQIRAFINDIACQIAKYLKIIFDKIMEYIMKMINKAMAPTIQSMPPNKRNLFLIIKEKIIELCHCLFNQITNGLCGQVQDYLDKNLNTDKLPSVITQASSGTGGVKAEVYTQITNICSVETLTGAIIFTNMPKIDDTTDKILNTVNGFLADMASDLAAAGAALDTASGYLNTAGSAISNVNTAINGITGSIMSALSFTNIKLSIFGCDLSPKCAVSDNYTLHEGGGGTEQPQLPRLAEVDANSRSNEPVKSTTEVAFATPLLIDTKVNYNQFPQSLEKISQPKQ